MTKNSELYIVRCDKCIQFKSKQQKVAMENIQDTQPLQLMHLGYIIFKATEGGKDVHVLIITDHFMRYAQALVTSLQTAKHRTQMLWDHVVHYGLPESIISHQGQIFKCDLIS